MSDEDALLAAIAAKPDEDTPRLVFADWLDEHDQPIRAEFIRVQIEVARVETLPRVLLNRYVDVFKRQQELLDNHREELLGPLAGLPDKTHFEFERGFVSEVNLSAYRFTQHCDLIAGTKPLPRVIVVDLVDGIRRFLNVDAGWVDSDSKWKIVSAIRALGTDDPGFAESDWARNLVILHSYRWPRLDELDISDCRLGDVNTARLLCADSFPVLANLDLSENDLTDSAVSSLLDSELTPQLKRLILGGNPIGDLGAIELAERWPTGADDKLQHLNLRFTNIGQPGQQALLARFGGRIELF